MPEMPQMPGSLGSLGSLGSVGSVDSLGSLGSLGSWGQVDLLHRGTLDRGRRGRGPQRGQQQRRFAQVRPAALSPVRAVRTGGDGVQGGDEGGGVGRPVLRLLGHPGRDQWPQRLGHRIQRHRRGQVLVQHPLGGVPDKGRMAGQALIEGGRGRIHIPGRAGRGAGELLGRRVHQTAGRHRLRHRSAPRCRNRSACCNRFGRPARSPACSRGARHRADVPSPAPAASPATPPAPPPPWSRPDEPGSRGPKRRPLAPSRWPRPHGDSTYSYSRTMFGSSRTASTCASVRNSPAHCGSASSLRRKYLIATRVPEASCLASTTSPAPPEPRAFSSV